MLGCGLVTLGLLAGAPAGAGASYAFPFDELVVFIHGVGSVPGVDYDQIVTDEPVDLDGIALIAFPDGHDLCTAVPALENGTTYTLLSTTGGLSGRLNDAEGTLEEGGVYPVLLPFGRGCSTSLGGLEIHHHDSGPVQTVTGTVVGGSPIPVTRTSLEAEPWVVETNQLATFTATISVSSGTAAGTVSFHDTFVDNDAIACPDQHVVATAGAPATAACQTTDSTLDDASRAGTGPSLSATFTPDEPALVRGSDGHAWISVRSGTTTTQLTPAAGTVTAGTPLDLLATVTPAFQGLFAPAGTVTFRDGGAVLPGCASLPLPADGSVHCSAALNAPGTHALTAEYVAVGPPEPWALPDFLGSTSAPVSVVVRPRRARGRSCPHPRAHRRAHTAPARPCTTIRA
jgi:Bacterial Ig-like domain (group 3)